MRNVFLSKTAYAIMAAGVFAMAVIAFIFLRPKTPGPSLPNEAFFQEAALESGITWQMHFLPEEQGEKFKINLYDHGSGVAVGDFDGDGYDDIYFVNELGRNALYKNKGDGTFEDVTDQAGVGLGDRICAAASFADYDNSGRQSLFVTSTRGGNVLFKNLGNGRFVDVTQKAGLTYIGHSQACVFFDFDNDGYLDLLVTNTAHWTTEELDPVHRYYRGSPNFFQIVANSPAEHNILYHNNGDGTFTDVTAQAGLQGKGWSGDAAVLDFNGDGYLDLVVNGMFGGAVFYRNNGNGTFTDVTKETLGRPSWGVVGLKAFDFNNDGLLDLFMVDMHSDMWMDMRLDWPEAVVEEIKRVAKKKFSSPRGPLLTPGEVAFKDMDKKWIFGNALFKNLGNGKFEEVSDKAGMETFWPWGIAAGDFDNDGYEDVFIPSGMGYPFFYWPNALMMNNGDETFTDRARWAGIEPPARGIYQDQKIGGRLASRSSRAAAVADFDGDGRLDLVVNNFNDLPYYFRNHFPPKNYVAFRLQGTRSNRDAIGAVVRLYAGKQIMTRQVNPEGGYLAQSSKTLHFGLGDRTEIDRVEIRWPSGIRQTLDHPAINQLHKIVEPEKTQ